MGESGSIAGVCEVLLQTGRTCSQGPACLDDSKLVNDMVWLLPDSNHVRIEWLNEIVFVAGDSARSTNKRPTGLRSPRDSRRRL